MTRFEEKVVLVTGAGSGIGRATAIAFAKEGAKVIVADISEEGASETVGMINGDGGEAIFIRVDVSKPEDHKMVVEKAVALYGKLDVAFNNAGIEGTVGGIGQQEVDAWQRVINVNLSGMFYALKYQVPQMIKQGGGAIVNTSSINGILGAPGNGLYGAAKHGVVGLTRSVGVENAALNIRCNAIAPGVIETNMVKRIVSPENREMMLRGIPARRTGAAEEIAKTVLFLASDDASYITGQVLPVDGGFSAL